jgi:hypothetical protein
MTAPSLSIPFQYSNRAGQRSRHVFNYRICYAGYGRLSIVITIIFDGKQLFLNSLLISIVFGVMRSHSILNSSAKDLLDPRNI